MYSDQQVTGTVPVQGSALPNDLFRSFSRYLSNAFVVPTAKRCMSTMAQRNNLAMLADQVLAFEVEGDFIELGCYEGSTARAIASAIHYHGNSRTFHVYDDFQFDPKRSGGVKERFIAAMEAVPMPVPIIHERDILGALANELPELIAFAHIDLGFEEEPRTVASMITKCVGAIYHRMAPGAVCVLMDYHDPIRTVKGWDCSPGVKMACDRFLLDKPERMGVLFGDDYSHAFFRKAIPR